MADYHDPVPRPELLLGPDGILTESSVPDGWTKIVVGHPSEDPTAPVIVLCGWSEDGEFHQYAETETIVLALFLALEDHHDRA